MLKLNKYLIIIITIIYQLVGKLEVPEVQAMCNEHVGMMKYCNVRES